MTGGRLDGLVLDAWARDRDGKDRKGLLWGVQYKWSTDLTQHRMYGLLVYCTVPYPTVAGVEGS